MYVSKNSDAIAPLSNLQDFHARGRKFRGESFSAEPLSIYRGRLNDENTEKLNHDLSVGITYIVYSYETPIGWVRKDGTTEIVDQKFSVTTSQQQYLLRQAWS